MVRECGGEEAARLRVLVHFGGKHLTARCLLANLVNLWAVSSRQLTVLATLECFDIRN